jgi:hypothetical protein
MLGRCKVRVVGIHTDNKTALPSASLPWAVPMQPITSAANSGIGHAPVGPIEGTTVIIQFLDEHGQIPMMLGTIAGVPGISNVDDVDSFSPAEDQLAISDQAAADTSTESTSTPTEQPTTATETTGEKYLGSLTKEQYDKMKEAIGKKESGGNYGAVGGSGGAYCGKYQFGIAPLEDLGYIKRGTYKTYTGKATTWDLPDIWTGKDGISSKSSFLSNTTAQEIIMDKYIKRNYIACQFNGKEIPEKLAGLLAVAHNQGSGSIKKFLAGQTTADGFGTTNMAYYSLVYAAVCGHKTNEPPTKENIYETAIDKGSPTANAKDNTKYDVSKAPVAQKKAVAQAEAAAKGFADPNGKYPLKDFLGEQDTPRLSRSQRLSRTIIGEKEADMTTGIPIAGNNVMWDQPPSAYGAKYPFNHVYSSESGHVLEFDDTPEAERINLHHTTGTFFEMYPDGSLVAKTVGTHIQIIEQDGLFYIGGSGHLTVYGDLSINVVGQCNIDVSGDASVKVSGNGYVDVAGNLNQKVGGAYNIECASMSVKSGGNIALDGSEIHMNDGSSVATTPAPTYAPTITLPEIVSRDDREAMILENTPQGEATAKHTETPPMTQTPAPSNETPPADTPTVSTTCDFVSVDENTQLSGSYKIKDLCKDGPFPVGKGQHGISDKELACNLKQLCLNILEPLKAKYGALGFKVNSGFRPAGGNISHASSGKISQHEKGMAADISFSAVRGKPGDRKKFYELAQEIKDLVPFDQMLLEYTDKGSVWIHLSYNPAGRRTDSTRLMTFNNHKSIGNGLILRE